MKLNRKVSTTIAIIFTVLVLALVLMLVDFIKLASAMESMDIRYFIIALWLVPVFMFLKSYRWYYLVRLKAPISFRDGMISYMSGSSLGLLTPAKTGELSRVLYLPVENKAKFTGSVIIDKVFDLMALMLLAIAGSYVLLGTWSIIAIIAVSLAMGLGMLSIGRLVAFASKFSIPEKLNIFLQIGEIASLRIRDIILCSSVSCAMFIVALVQCYFLVSAFEKVDVWIVIFSFPLIILTNVLPITIGGLGVRESAAILLLSRFGVTAVTAFNASFLIFLLDTVLPAVVGALLISKVTPRYK